MGMVDRGCFLHSCVLSGISIFLTSPGTVPAVIPSRTEARHGAILGLVVVVMCDPIDRRQVRGRLVLYNVDFRSSCRALGSLVVGRYGIRSTALDIVFGRGLLSSSLGAVAIGCCRVSRAGRLCACTRLLGGTCCVTRSRRNRGRFVNTGLCNRIFRTVLPNRFVAFSKGCCRVRAVAPLGNIITHETTSRVADEGCCHRVEGVGLRGFTRKARVTDGGSISKVRVVGNFTSVGVRASNCLRVGSCNGFGSTGGVLVGGIPNEGCGGGDILGVGLPKVDRGIECAVYLLLGRVFEAACPGTCRCVSTIRPGASLGSRSLGCIACNFSNRYSSRYFCVVRSDSISLNLVISIREGLGHCLRVVASILV